MSKPSAPSAPDPYASAGAQYSYGTAAANYNAGLGHTNIITPYGSQTWSAQQPGESVSPSYSETPTASQLPYVPGYSTGSQSPVPSFGLGGPAGPDQIGGIQQPASGETPWQQANTMRIDNQIPGNDPGRNPLPGGPTPPPSIPPPSQPGSTGSGYGPYNQPGTNYDTGSLITGPNGEAVPQAAPPTYTQTTQLSPAQQELLNLQEGNQISAGMSAGNLAAQTAASTANPLALQTGVANTPVQSQINTSGVPGIAGAGNLAGFTDQAQNATYQQQTQYLNPQFAQEKEQLQAQLTNQGAQPGDAAWNNAMTLFNNQQQQAYQSASNNAVEQGLAEQQALYGESANTNQQLFGEAATQGQFANEAAGQRFGQELQGAGFGNSALIQQQQLPLQEYLALNGQTAAGGTPSFGLAGGGSGGAGGVQAPDIMSAFNNQYQGELANYNAGVASTNADVGAGASLASSYLMYLALA
jgi:hypothetical protein